MNKKINAVVLVGKYEDQEIESFIKKVATFLSGLGVEVFLDSDTSLNLLDNKIPTKEPNEATDIDAIIVLGGDGTMMGAARRWGITSSNKNIPLVGINHGRIGFLTDIPQASVFESLNAIINGDYKKELRDVIKYSLKLNNDLLSEGVAINDLIVGRSITGKLMEFTVFVNDEFVYSQLADGIIITNPTGSTAYSLAAGGSILHPNCKVFTIVPICPQILSNRPIVIDNESKIKILFSGTNNLEYFVDGIKMKLAPFGSYFEIQRNIEQIELIHPQTYSYFSGLRTKLNWVNG